jgi:sarcosine oxidase
MTATVSAYPARVPKAEVVVIGAGAMGSSTAWWLARRGHDVVLLEQFEQGHTRGSSHGGSRIFRYAYPTPDYVRLAQEALPLWRELEDEAGETLLEITGAVDHGDAASVHDVAGAMAACAVPHELLTADAAAERWPGMRFEGEVLFHPGGGRCRADATVAALQRLAHRNGADVRFNASASLLVDDDRVTVAAGDESWSAPVAVVTAGAWVRAVLGTRAPDVVVTQEQVQHFTPLDAGRDGAGWPSFIHHRVPWVYGLHTPGEGVKVAEHHVGPLIDPDRRVARDANLERTIVEYVREWFPGLDPTPTHTAECLYTTTPDESFVLDRVGPVVIGSPCSGHGFKFTPAIGRRLADLAVRKT